MSVTLVKNLRSYLTWFPLIYHSKPCYNIAINRNRNHLRHLFSNLVYFFDRQSAVDRPRRQDRHCRDRALGIEIKVFRLGGWLQSLWEGFQDLRNIDTHEIENSYDRRLYLLENVLSQHPMPLLGVLSRLSGIWRKLADVYLDNLEYTCPPL